MNKKIMVAILSTTLVFNNAKASDDDIVWAVGGFILGTIVGDRHKEREHPPERVELPPPRRQPRLVPIYSKVCQIREQYDPWGHPLPPVRTCWQEITGYQEVYE